MYAAAAGRNCILHARRASASVTCSIHRPTSLGTTLFNNQLIISGGGRLRANTISDLSSLRVIQNIAIPSSTTWTNTLAKFIFLPGRFRALLAHHASVHAKANDLLVALKKNAPIGMCNVLLPPVSHLLSGQMRCERGED